MEDLTREEEIALLEMELRAILKKLFARDINSEERVARILREMKWKIGLSSTSH